MHVGKQVIQAVAESATRALVETAD